MSTPTTAEAVPLDEKMLTMDVVDTLRHSEDIGAGLLNAEARESQLVARLRGIYRLQGIEVSDAILKDGVAALDEKRFVYSPPRTGPQMMLARLYVARSKWARPISAVMLALLIGLGAYFLGYRPYRASQAEAARIELEQGLPAQMDALYQTIYNETKVQTAVADAGEYRVRGNAAAAADDRPGAESAIASLTALRDLLREDYTLRVVSRQGIKPGFWTFPSSNTEATNYYIVVEADGANSQTLSLPIANEETGKIETVSMWGLRVPQAVYDSVAADKQDDGVVEHSVVGVKQFGFTDIDYVIPVLGGAVTKW